jgi:hypothetical protein
MPAVTRGRIVALHVALPLALGVASYAVLRAEIPGLVALRAPLWPDAPAALRDHFADGAWGWALGAFVSVVWLGERAPRRAAWVAAAALLAAGVECLQIAHIGRGVFDGVDLAVQVGAVLVAAWVTGRTTWTGAPA